MSGEDKYQALLTLCRQAAEARTKHLWRELHALATHSEQQRISAEQLGKIFTELDQQAEIVRLECAEDALLRDNHLEATSEFAPLTKAVFPLRLFFKDGGSGSRQDWTCSYDNPKWYTDFSDL